MWTQEFQGLFWMQSMMTKIFENNMKWFNVECARPCSANLGGFVF